MYLIEFRHREFVNANDISRLDVTEGTRFLLKGSTSWIYVETDYENSFSVALQSLDSNPINKTVD